MRMLNLGCGYNYNTEWVNVDFFKTGDNVIAYNLKEGIPYIDNEFDVVYHSHLLEHFPNKEAPAFLKECYRVLKSGGIIRIVVPDLDAISKEYQHNLNRAINGEPGAEYDYDWIMLEMYDQTVRNSSGGEMAKYLNRKEIPNRDYVFSRIGIEGKNFDEKYTNSISSGSKKEKEAILYQIKIYLKRLVKNSKSRFLNVLLKEDLNLCKKNKEALEIGLFRLSGEVHQWMYDRYSLGKLLGSCGFKKIKTISAFESDITGWERFQLDVKDKIVRKPDSLFMEAMK